jgi:hypothetical protein
MTDDGLDASISQQLERLRSEGKLQVQNNRRCRICRDDDVRKLINTLHGYGLTTRSIMDIVDSTGLNTNRSGRDQINYDVVWRHTRKHFDVDAPAREIYREILARRSAEEGKDIDRAVGSAVNALSYLETMMVRGYQDLTDEATRIPYSDGVKAAVKLHELTRADSGVQEIAEVMRKMNYVISAVMTAVPEQYHSDIVAIMEGREPARQAAIADIHLDEDEDEDQDYDPVATAESDDDEDD